MRISDKEIKDALDKVESIVLADKNKLDIQYFQFHKERYRRMAATIGAGFSKGASILNIGSHYLHTSLLFKFLGYEVHSMDVKVFWDLPFVQERCDVYDMIKIVDNDLETFSTHNDVCERYDVVTFAEILEHITFNPIGFWRKIYEVLKPLGMIYISTPNSLNLYNIVRTIARILTFRGIGLPIGSIFANVTYGHHWKEYSSSEIKKYFGILSDDFMVHTSFYHYRKSDFNGFYPTIMSVFSALGNAMYYTSDEIEAVVKVNKSGNWKIKSPVY